ncbi:hypothetical protein EVAR_19132_1 [Eumeta japonica]|uniref:Uncharacterized protein n=1 Tax=Eumeta variegata TaxID=151549 RepID=A0A4C1SQC3_EUMVA|nr:hypothetical protein EVAR_19132_1 [Eumeta japonica]
MSPAQICGGVGAGKSRRARGTQAAEKRNAGADARPGGAGGDPKVVADLRRVYELRRSGGETKTAAAAARPWPLQDLVPDTLIVASKFENHTAEHVITKLRGVVDARRWVWPWTDEEGQGTKVLSCSSVEDAKR